jgi:N-methylhydantoinase A
MTTPGSPRLEAALDVGGTFIDVVVARADSSPTIRVAKISRRELGVEGRLRACLESLTEEAGGTTADIATVVVGTTVVTNCLLEEDFARTALLATRGFADVIEIARANRLSSFDLKVTRPRPIVPRALRYEVDERKSADGSTLYPLDPVGVADVARRLSDASVESIAVSFLFSYLDPSAERAAAAILSATLGVPVTISSDVLPTIREYERTNTTVINAATIPKMARFIEGIGELVADAAQVYIMGSEGGALTLPEAGRFPVRCTMSGPVGGVLASSKMQSDSEAVGLLTLDIGGTSADVAFVDRGQVAFVEERMVGRYDVAMPSIEVETVGAGGGSIAHVNELGLLQTGPQSAGAAPGPVCYGNGGSWPTVTDAHVALGRMGVDSMLGGHARLDRDAAIGAIEEKIAKPLDIDWQQAALGILDVIGASIVRPLRRMSVARGIDPRTLTLVAFGGAGPLHGLDVARLLAIPRVLIPTLPGLWSAVGLLGADVRYSVTQTWLRRVAEVTDEAFKQQLDAARAGLVQKAAGDGLDTDDMTLDARVRVRYIGQTHALSVPGTGSLGELAQRFHALHFDRYGHHRLDEALEIVEFTASLLRARTSVPPVLATGANAGPIAHRDIWFSPDGPERAAVFSRAMLAVGSTVEGPAVIEQYDSNVVLRFDEFLTVRTDGVLELRRRDPDASSEFQASSGTAGR